ncbi:MAG: cbb3-type cytochrome c oxidase subunit II [Actinomycetia bacterium]|nr:cbb3-type cytochrome c oxidase subunit II [Actinomycetes bacterium]
MSEFLEAAAQVVGAPPELVQRSAEARADADGVSVDDVLRAWAGGGPAPSSPPAVEMPPPPPAASAAPPPPPPAAPPPAAAPPPPAAVPPPPAASAPDAPVVAAPARPAAVDTGPPPVLTGRVDRPFRYFFGAAALLILCLVVTLVLPTFSETGRGALHSEIPYTASALRGQGEYLAEGCAGCHTQMVRPIVADAQLAAAAGVGGITLSDTNQVIGRQRYGPDLANVGNRMSPEEIEAVLQGEGGHVLYRGSWMDDLVAYLAESRVLTESAQ